jgi:hypothetical protein|tara:strand:- start:2180 stop:2371 length:192 start_codon:yes stop_codon:yes gene_type:complete
MYIEIIIPILRNGKRYNEGDKINLPNNIASNWIKKKLAINIPKKVNKEKFETKELKTNNIETK